MDPITVSEKNRVLVMLPSDLANQMEQELKGERAELITVIELTEAIKYRNGLPENYTRVVTSRNTLTLPPAFFRQERQNPGKYQFVKVDPAILNEPDAAKNILRKIKVKKEPAKEQQQAIEATKWEEIQAELYNAFDINEKLSQELHRLYILSQELGKSRGLFGISKNMVLEVMHKKLINAERDFKTPEFYRALVYAGVKQNVALTTKVTHQIMINALQKFGLSVNARQLSEAHRQVHRMFWGANDS